MRAIWKGAVSFGLVSIAVRLYSATEEKDIRFHQVHREDGGRIRYKRTCSVCGEEVTYDDIAKGYDIGGGEMVILTDEDFADLPLSTSRAIDVLEFVPAEQVDPILYNKAYYLEPEGIEPGWAWVAVPYFDLYDLARRVRARPDLPVEVNPARLASLSAIARSARPRPFPRSDGWTATFSMTKPSSVTSRTMIPTMFASSSATCTAASRRRCP